MEKQTIHLVEADAIAEADALTAVLSPFADPNTISYNCALKHPTEEKWGVRYMVDGPLWASVNQYLTDNSITLEDITADWDYPDA